MYYIDTNSRIHCLEDDNFLHLLPEGSKPISEDEAVKLLATTSSEVDPVQDAKAFLAFTDWYAIRKVETGKEIPADVARKREAARAIISKG